MCSDPLPVHQCDTAREREREGGREGGTRLNAHINESTRGVGASVHKHTAELRVHSRLSLLVTGVHQLRSPVLS